MGARLLGLLGLLVAGLLLVAESAGATTYYVRTTGNDANSGLSPAQAWLTIEHAGDTLLAGDTAYIGGGTYTDKVDVQNSGTAADPIRFVGDTTGAFTGDAGAVVLDTGGDAFKIDNEDYVEIIGLEVRGDKKGFKIKKAVGIRIESCSVHDSDLAMEIDESEVEIVGCDLRGSKDEGLRIKKDSNVTLTDTIIRESGKAGIKIDDHDAVLLASRCEVHSNDEEGLELKKGTVSLVNCLFYGNGKDGIKTDHDDAELTVWHSTIAGNGDAGIWVKKGSATVTNSILASNAGAGLDNEGSLTHSFNLLWTNAGGDYVGTGPATGEISADPQFPGATDFHILVTSPARDTGTDASAVTAEDRDGSPRPQRLGYDMGAYEVLEVFDHFEVVHDGFGIHCLSEVIVLRAIATDGDPFDYYEGSVTLTARSGRGTWSSVGGNAGSFADPVADDGEAFYTFDDADDGEAIFVLDYPEGPPAIDVDVFENGDPTRIDDDGEGLLVWSPSGFTVTANPLPNPPPDPIFDPIATQTAAVPFSVHITAYGQTPTDPLCGVIEGYDGSKNLELWSLWDDPATGTLAVQIDGVAIGTSEAAATPQPVAFVAGQAAVTARYDDVGRIQIAMKDTNVVEPAAGIRGATNPFVVRPADFVLSGIQRSADSFPNPDPPAVDENGPVFIAAGADFTVTVTAVDAEGDPTPNYGQESVPESVTLASGLVAAGGTANPPIVAGGGGSGFGPFATGSATGTQFGWNEVGIIALTPSVADGSYLGTGDVVGNPSGNVGRFIPFDFDVVVDTAAVLATPCGVGGYGYVGQSFGWAQAPVLRVTARSVSGSTTRNYTGAWWKLTSAALAAAGGPVYLSDPGAPAGLDPSGLPPAGTDPIIVELGDGTGTLTFGLGSGLRFARVGPVAPFDAEIALSIDVADEDGVVYAANPFRVGDPSPGNGMAWSAGRAQRYGRLALVNAFGSERVALPVPLRAEYWTGSAFALHGDDSCTAVTAANVGTTARSPAALATAPVVGNLPLVAGDAGLFFTAPGADGWADVLVNLSAVDVATPWGPIVGADLPWLRWDWSGDGAGPTYDEDPGARITFGIFGGDAPVIFRREIY